MGQKDLRCPRINSAISMNVLDDFLLSVADAPRINNANVTATDIKTSNGVIHVIDTVLIPQ